jgi:glycosyltransferase involved in cell wall biosynthesis
MKIVIIMPSLNRPDYHCIIEKCIQEQIFDGEIELLIAEEKWSLDDHGSRVKNAKYIELNCDNDRILSLHEKYNALNKAAIESGADYIIQMDSDNYFGPNYIRKAINILQQSKKDFLCHDSYYLYDMINDNCGFCNTEVLNWTGHFCYTPYIVNILINAQIDNKSHLDRHLNYDKTIFGLVLEFAGMKRMTSTDDLNKDWLQIRHGANGTVQPYITWGVDDIVLSDIVCDKDILDFYHAHNQTKITNQILIAPWSNALPDGRTNAKNYPYWRELVALLKPHYHVTQIGRMGEKELCSDVRFYYDIRQIADLLRQADTFISVDSFLPHLAHKIGKSGIVLFGQSDPNIFGYDENINLLKDRNYLRPNQFEIWDNCEYNREAFVEPEAVLRALGV